LSYYRAALASARMGDFTAAARLVQCSLVFKEDAPYTRRFLELLRGNADIDASILSRLLTLTEKQKYKKALKIRLPVNTKAHTIRGLLYAELGNFPAARQQFALALALDTGNTLARNALLILTR